MSHWTEKELASTQMDDERLRKRLKKLTETLSQSLCLIRVDANPNAQATQYAPTTSDAHH